jgi:hypothetical protein
MSGIARILRAVRGHPCPHSLLSCFREIAGRICRQLIRQSRLRWQAMFDWVRFARLAQINSIYISRVASRF